jgi:hypothetical protein
MIAPVIGVDDVEIGARAVAGWGSLGGQTTVPSSSQSAIGASRARSRQLVGAPSGGGSSDAHFGVSSIGLIG